MGEQDGSSAQAPALPEERPTLPAETLEWIRRTRRRPGPTQPDFLILRRLVQNLSLALGSLSGPLEVLDVFCGTRPYEDLLPVNSMVTGFDVDDHYGSADVTSDEFLPFEDSSFDLVLCTESFHFLPDPHEAARELRRVLRPGGMLVLTVPVVWEYDRSQLEHRYTGSELASVFEHGWQEVSVNEVGGYAVAWATLTGRILRAAEELLARRAGWRRIARPLFTPLYLALNAAAVLLDRFERRLWRPSPHVLPADLMLTARRADG